VAKKFLAFKSFLSTDVTDGHRKGQHAVIPAGFQQESRDFSNNPPGSRLKSYRDGKRGALPSTTIFTEH
jgi:hypothetical protein